MRYVGQNYDINVAIPQGRFDEKVLRSTEGNFTRAHQRLFGHSQGAEKEFVNLRVTITGLIHRPPFRTLKRARNTSAVPKGTRNVYFGRGRTAGCAVYDRASLGRGTSFLGPCVVEGPDSTIVVYPGQRAVVDRYADLIIRTR